MNFIRVTVQKNGKYWQARWRLNNKQYSKGLGPMRKVTKVEARKKARAIEAEVNAGVIAAGTPTIESLFRRFLDHNAAHFAEGTVYLYDLSLRYLVAFFGKNRCVDTITPADAADWRAAVANNALDIGTRRRKERSESTVCRIVKEARNVFWAACKDKIILTSPFDHLEYHAPAPDIEWRYIDRPTLRKIMDKCPNDRWRLLLALCRYAGLRLGEAMRLKWSEVDWDSRRLTVQNPLRYKSTKKKTRILPIDPELYELLLAVFTDADYAKGGEVLPGMAYKGLRCVYRRILRRAGVETYQQPFHMLRKNCEADWVARYPMHVTAKWLGHSPMVAMKSYLTKVQDGYYDLASSEVAPSAEKVAALRAVPASEAMPSFAPNSFSPGGPGFSQGR